MDIKITELELLLDKINLLFNDIKSDGKIDPLETGLFLKYLKQLQDKVEALSPKAEVKPVEEIKQTSIPDLIKTEEKMETPVIKPVVQEVVPEKIHIPEKQITTDLQKNHNEEKKTVLEKDERKEIPVTGKTHKKPLIKIPDDDEDEETTHTGLNNKLSKEKKTLADKIVTKKAMDLRSAVDLNDRIYFIRILFNGDSHAYDKAIRHINAIQSPAELKTYITQELSAQYKWDDHDATERFTEVVGRKFE